MRRAVEEYAAGRLLDSYGESGPVVLLWHGRGPDERDVLARLAGVRPGPLGRPGAGGLVARCGDRGWPVRLDELDADHAGIVGAVYDPAIGRCRPSDAPAAVSAAERSAAAIRHLAGLDR